MRSHVVQARSLCFEAFHLFAAAPEVSDLAAVAVKSSPTSASALGPEAGTCQEGKPGIARWAVSLARCLTAEPGPGERRGAGGPRGPRALPAAPRTWMCPSPPTRSCPHRLLRLRFEARTGTDAVFREQGEVSGLRVGPPPSPCGRRAVPTAPDDAASGDSRRGSYSDFWERANQTLFSGPSRPRRTGLRSGGRSPPLRLAARGGGGQMCGQRHGDPLPGCP